MNPTLGFVFVTHNQPTQTLRLCARLSAMFNDPPIAIHHDFSQSQVDREQFPGNVRFVENWVKTGWGVIGVVDALLAALRLLYRSADGWGDPDWFVSLSSADYPIQTPEQILQDLRKSTFDGYLDSRAISYYPGPFIDEKLGEFPFQQPRYKQVALRRYMAIPLVPLQLARRYRISVEKYCLTAPWMTERFTPYRNGTRCYAGDAWMTMRRSVAEHLLDETPFWHALHQHLDGRLVPKESFHPTVLGNQSRLQISPDNLRYTDWKGCYAHPRTLSRDDFDRLLASNCNFARKFPDDPGLLRELDGAVTRKQDATVAHGTP